MNVFELFKNVYLIWVYKKRICLNKLSGNKKEMLVGYNLNKQGDGDTKDEITIFKYASYEIGR